MSPMVPNAKFVSVITAKYDRYWILPNLTRSKKDYLLHVMTNISSVSSHLIFILANHFVRTSMVFNVTVGDGTTIDMPYGGDFYLQRALFQNILIQRPNCSLYASLRNYQTIRQISHCRFLSWYEAFVNIHIYDSRSST